MQSETLDFLTKKPRIAGSERNREVARFLEDKYRHMGYDVDVDEHKFMGWELIEDPVFSFLKPEKKKAITTQMIWSGSTDGKVRGRIVYSGIQLTFEAYPFKKYSIVDKKGKEMAYILTRDDMVWLQSLTNAMDNTPCCLVDTESCRQIEKWIEKGKEIEAEFSIKTGYKPDSVLRNIVAEKKGKKATEILICAHYDSTPNSPGANDNGSGTLALLDLAEKLSKRDFNNTIRFVSFDAEEWNKIGSTMYVEGRKQKITGNKTGLKTKISRYLKKQTDLDKIKAVINIDTVGSGDKICSITSKKYVDAVRSGAKDSGIVVEVREGYDAPQFDGWPFHTEGIPVIHLVVSPYKYFHTPQDTKDKIEPRFIKDVTELVESIVDKLDKD